MQNMIPLMSKWCWNAYGSLAFMSSSRSVLSVKPPWSSLALSYPQNGSRWTCASSRLSRIGWFLILYVTCNASWGSPIFIEELAQIFQNKLSPSLLFFGKMPSSIGLTTPSMHSNSWKLPHYCTHTGWSKCHASLHSRSRHLQCGDWAVLSKCLGPEQVLYLCTEAHPNIAKLPNTG